MEKIQKLTLEGPPHERGRIHGEALRSGIRELIEAWKEGVAGLAGMHPDDYVSRLVQGTGFLEAAERWTPNALEEVRGIADGSGIDFQTVFAFQLGDEDLWYPRELRRSGSAGGDVRCSVIGMAGSADRPTLLAQNMDWSSSFDSHQVVLHVKDPGLPHELMLFSSAGLLSMNGLNSGAIGVCVNTLKHLDYSTLGLPVVFVIRGVLDQSSLEEALAFLQRVTHASGQNYMLADAERVADFECSARQACEYVPIGGSDRICHTNHPLSNRDQGLYEECIRGFNEQQQALVELSDRNSRDRLAHIEAGVQGGETEVTVEGIKTLLSSHGAPVCFHGQPEVLGVLTLGCTIMELQATAPALHVSPGPPCSTRFETFTL